MIYKKSQDFPELNIQFSKNTEGTFLPITYKDFVNTMLDFSAGLLAIGEKEYSMKTQHGFARDMEFDLKECGEDHLLMVLKNNESTAQVYPFDFTLSVRYSLCGASLTMDIEVKNDSDKLMPYMIGWHPGFCIEGLIDDYSIQVKNGETVKRNYMKPSLFIDPEAVNYPLYDGIFKLTEKEIYGEDTLIFSNIGGESKLLHKGETVLTIKQSDNLPYYAIWKAPHSGAEYICLEPWSDIPADGVTPECFDTRKMSRLESGKAESYLFTVEFAI